MKHSTGSSLAARSQRWMDDQQRCCDAEYARSTRGEGARWQAAAGPEPTAAAAAAAPSWWRLCCKNTKDGAHTAWPAGKSKLSAAQCYLLSAAPLKDLLLPFWIRFAPRQSLIPPASKLPSSRPACVSASRCIQAAAAALAAGGTCSVLYSYFGPLCFGPRALHAPRHTRAGTLATRSVTFCSSWRGCVSLAAVLASSRPRAVLPFRPRRPSRRSSCAPPTRWASGLGQPCHPPIHPSTASGSSCT